jgi:hypothetical protein
MYNWLAAFRRRTLTQFDTYCRILRQPSEGFGGSASDSTAAVDEIGMSKSLRSRTGDV